MKDTWRRRKWSCWDSDHYDLCSRCEEGFSDLTTACSSHIPPRILWSQCMEAFFYCFQTPVVCTQQISHLGNHPGWERVRDFLPKENGNDNFFIYPVKRRSHFYWLAGLSCQSMVFLYITNLLILFLIASCRNCEDVGGEMRGKSQIKPLPAFMCCCSCSCKSINETPTPSHEWGSPC